MVQNWISVFFKNTTSLRCVNWFGPWMKQNFFKKWKNFLHKLKDYMNLIRRLKNRAKEMTAYKIAELKTINEHLCGSSIVFFLPLNHHVCDIKINWISTLHIIKLRERHKEAINLPWTEVNLQIWCARSGIDKWNAPPAIVVCNSNFLIWLPHKRQILLSILINRLIKLTFCLFKCELLD